MPPKGSKRKNLKRKADLISERPEEADTASIVETSENVNAPVTTADAHVSDIPPPQITPETDMSAAGHVIQLDTAPAVTSTTTEPVGDTPKESVLTDPSKQDEPSSSNPVEIGPEPLSSHPAAAATTAESGVSPNNNVYDSIRYCIISNDGNHDNLVKLIGLKSLFAKMLPKMPKEYIVRLVMDKRHKSLAILSDDPSVKGGDDEIIAGICYRPYSDMRFGEVAFCAVAMSQQIKGYGTKIMNLLKMNVVKEGLEYLITYADNYAIGYFKKQGFTKTISMPKGRYHGLIKDYDGGTMMECYVHPSIDYTRIPEMIQTQREFVLSRVRLISKSDKVVYPPLPAGWRPHIEGTKRGHEAATKAMCIPGVAEAGWTMHDLITSANATKENDRRKNNLKCEILALIHKVSQHHCAWPFRQPVDTKEVPEYLKIIKEPMDLSTMEKKAVKGQYESKKMLYIDMLKMTNNCKTFNDPTTSYYDLAKTLESFFSTLFSDVETN